MWKTPRIFYRAMAVRESRTHDSSFYFGPNPSASESRIRFLTKRAPHCAMQRTSAGMGALVLNEASNRSRPGSAAGARIPGCYAMFGESSRSETLRPEWEDALESPFGLGVAGISFLKVPRNSDSPAFSSSSSTLSSLSLNVK